MSANHSPNSKALKTGKSTPWDNWGRAKGLTSLTPGLEHEHLQPYQSQTETAMLWEAGVGWGRLLDLAGITPTLLGWAVLGLCGSTSPLDQSLPKEWRLPRDSVIQPAQSPSPSSRVPLMPSSGESWIRRGRLWADQTLFGMMQCL